MQRILDRDRFTARDSDIDGRPPTGSYGADPLLEALIREHPERVSREMAANLPDDHLGVVRAALREYWQWVVKR